MKAIQLMLALALAPFAAATNQVVSNATEQSSGFTNGSLGAFNVCTTQPVNWPIATTLNGQPCARFIWHEWRANDNRDTKGSEVCAQLAIQKEGWYGFYIYLPEPGFTTTSDSAICQYFANNSSCNSWAAHLVMRGRDLLVTHRGHCSTPVAGVVRPNFPRNAWVSIITHFVVSHQGQGQFQVWVDDVLAYNAQNINFGYDTWDGSDALLAPDSIGYKLGQYNYAGGDVDEVRTSYCTNVSQISGNPPGIYNYIHFPVVTPSAPPAPINRATSGIATASTQRTPDETAAKAFDGLNSSKWYNNNAGPIGWLRYQFAPQTAWAINRYDLTSASDVPGRDPRDWDFQGSNDGNTWTTLDTRSGQTFADRQRRNEYSFINAIPFAYYRLNVTANNGDPSGLQLAELALYTGDPVPPPVARYALESDATDSSGNGRHGTPSNVTYAAGKLITAGQFNGTSSSIIIPKSLTNDFTVAMWLKTTQTTAAGTQWWQGAGLVDGEVAGKATDWGTSLLNGKFALGIGGTTGTDATFQSTSTINNGAWRHVAASRNGATGEVHLFIDGLQETTGTGPLGARAMTPAFRIGSLQTGLGFFNGQLDDVRLYEGILSPAEIAVLANPPPAPASLTATGGVNRITLAWPAVQGAAGYEIWRSTVSGSGFTNLANLGQPGHIDETAANAIAYYYRVSALEGQSSPEASAIAVPPVTAVELLGPAVALTGDVACLTLPASVVGRSYQLQRSNSLQQGTWQNIGTPVSGTGSPLQLEDPSPPQPRSFYRVLISPG